MILLPVAAFLLFFLILRKKAIDARRAFLATATFCGTSVVLITEFLSLPRLLTRSAVAIAWLTVSAICLAVYVKVERSTTSLPFSDRDGVEHKKDDLDRTTIGLLCAAGVIVLLVAITALLAPPSGDDGMTYHMPRVAMWISNHNVRFFPTANYTQLIYGAFAEYSIMHTILLGGSDRFANMIQFFSFVGCAIAVSYIVKLLGGSKRAQALAAVMSITIPEGILEASGPMTTYSASFWIATTVAFLLAWNEEASWLNTVCIGLAAGMAVFTKGTTYIILPFFVLACWWAGSRAKQILFVKRSVVFVALILAINSAQYLRNYEFDGSPLGVPLDYGQLHLTVENISVGSTLANILRNISFHTGTPVESLNSKIEHGFRATMHIIGVDPDDPRQVIWDERFVVNHMSFQELLAGDPWHFILLLAALGIVFARFRRPENRVLLWYALAITAAFVALCAILKWQRWSSRFHLCFFVLGAAVIALILARCVPRRLVTAISVGLLVWGLLNASMNRFRSLVPVGRWESAYEPREKLYFSYGLDRLAPSYIGAADAVNNTDCATVGIDSYIPLSDPEIKHTPDSFVTYPLLALIHADGRRRTAIFSGVHNLTARYAAKQPHPPACAIICLECAKVPAKWEQYASLTNHAVFGDTVVFSSASQPLR
jgi:hypothetical protein